MQEAPDESQGEEQLFPKVRLTMTKTDRIACLSHLEYMTLIQRAVRRAGLPVKYSSGFHPAPRISFGDALPLGVSSHAELVDLELKASIEPAEVMERLNRELPSGTEVLVAEPWPRKGDSPANSILSAIYSLPLHDVDTRRLNSRIEAFLSAEQVIVKRTKKGREENLDLRPWVKELWNTDDHLSMTLKSGSPLFLAAHLLEREIEVVRAMGICKTKIELKEPDIPVDL